MTEKRRYDVLMRATALVAAMVLALAALAGGCSAPDDDEDDGNEIEGENELTVSYSLGLQTFPVNWVGVEPVHESQMVKVSIAPEKNLDCITAATPCMAFWLRWDVIDTAGSYVIVDSWTDGPAQVWFWPSPEDDAGLSFSSTSGSLHLEEFGTEWGDRIVGSLATDMESEQDTDGETHSGSVEATFELIVGAENYLD